MTRQAFDTVDVLALEVGTRPVAEIVNLLKNPDGKLGAWGWITPPADVQISASFLDGTNAETISGVSDLTFTASGPSGVIAYITSEPEPCAVGQWCAGQIYLTQTIPASRAAEVSIVFLNSAGAQISRTGTTFIASGSVVGSAWRTAAVQAPAGTTHAMLRVDNLAMTSGARTLKFNHASLVVGASAAAAGGYFYVAPWTYTDILGTSHEITVERAGLSLGILTAKIRSASLDPSVSATIKPGNPIRLMARLADGFGAYYPEATRAPIFTGEIKHANVSYDLFHPDPEKRALITLTAVDASARLANLKQPDAVGTIGDLRYLLEGCSTPWEVNGTTNNVPGAPVVVARNDNASVLDQVALTRDTKLGHAWVSRYGVLKARDANLMNTTVQSTLTQSVYNADADIDFDTARCINSVTVKRQTLDPVDATRSVETVFGPYVDDASVKAWGSFSAEFSVVGLADAAIAGFAASILAANATPVRRVNRVTIPIKDSWGFVDESGPSGLQRRAHLDLYDRVTVTNTTAGLDQTLRISGIKHRITTKKWLMDLTFASTGGVAMPSPAPPLAGEQTFADTPWVNVTFENGYSNLDAVSFDSGQYCRRGGIVYLRGMLNGGTNDGTYRTGTIFTLPPGFRPSKLSHIRVAAGAANADNTSERITISPAGLVQSNHVPAASWFSLSYISYPAEQ